MCVMTIEGWQIVADVVGHVIWPILVAALVFAFRKPIYNFLSDAEEAGWGGAKVKRGNQRSSALKAEATDNVPGDDGDDENDAPVLDADALVAEAELPPTVQTLRYYRRIVLDRLRRSKYNTDTSSARLGGEIVGSTYADLKQTVRLVGFLVQGTGSTRGPLASLEATLSNLTLPDDLVADITDARQIALDVTNHTIKVTGPGASDYIDSISALVARVIDWGIRESTPPPI